MTPFRTKIDVAYVASWLDCLFDKGIAFNGKLPDGSKPLSSMHGIFAPLAPTREELQTAPLTTQPGSTHHQRLQLWASNFKILNFSAINANVKSFKAFQEACKRLMEVPEIRRACFESPLAYHAINGKHCYIHPRLGIPLPSRATLSGSALWDNTQHRKF